MTLRITLFYLLSAAWMASARLAARRATVSTAEGKQAVVVRQDTAVQMVKVSQVWVGDEEKDCGKKATTQTTANRMVLVYRDPDTGAMACDRYAKVDACFQRTMLIGCDPETNAAELTLYVTDPVFSPQMVVTNPQLPFRCGLGDVTQIRRTLLHKTSFPCGTDTDQSCQDDSSCMVGKEYCGYRGDDDQDRHCLPYVANDGAVCGGTLGIQCDPSSHYCYDADHCVESTASSMGTCQPLSGGACTTNDDCEEGIDYCDSGSCQRLRDEGDCCQEDDQCRNSICKLGQGNGVCTETCESNADCPVGTWCGSEGDEGRFCKSYVGVGSRCGGYQEEPDRCDPSVSFCSATDTAAAGECLALGDTCTATLDCRESLEYCDTSISKCKPKNEDQSPCLMDDECMDGSVCSNEVCIPGKDPVNRPKQCTTDADCGAGLEFCTHNSDLNGLYCKAFSSTGGPCRSDQSLQCAPNSFCHRPQECDYRSTDTEEGICTLLGDSCWSDTNCDDSSYCDHLAGRCKPRSESGECCTFGSTCADANDACQPDLERFGVGGPMFCLPKPPACEETSDCDEGYYCTSTTGLDFSICKAYASEGGMCGSSAVAHPDLLRWCDPRTTYCDSRTGCSIFDGAGVCTALGSTCKAHVDCTDENEFCDKGTGTCLKRVGQGSCCSSDAECSDEFECGSFDRGHGDIISMCMMPGSSYYHGGPMPSGGGPMPSGGGPMPSGGGPMPSGGGPGLGP